MVIDNSAKRVGIFFFYDQEGIVDEYVTYLLSGLKSSLERLVIVCNGTLSASGRQKLEGFSSEILVRENRGYDVAAYKAAIEYIGWEQLKAYDEVVIFNHTIMGPVYSFSDMFDEMNKRDLDFWGITKYGQESFDPFGYSPYGYLPEHIQSHFLVFRKSLVCSLDFKYYWDNMPEIKSYNDSVGIFESLFTKQFEEKGFVWDVYINTDEYKGLTTFPLMNYAREMVENKHCPIFKRRTFFQPYDYVLGNTMGQAAGELFEYLEQKTNYPTDLIWDNLLRTCHQADLVRTLHLDYIIPTDKCIDKLSQNSQDKKIALVMHLYFIDLIEESFSYACTMPENADVYITTNTEEKKGAIEKVFSKGKFNHCEVRVIENRGRDVSSILVGVKDVIMKYDIACFVHDKKTAQINPGSVGAGFAYKCFKNTLYNKKFVNNVLDVFEKNPRLGLLAPPMPNHADYFPLLCNEWGPNFDTTKKLAEQLNINVPMSAEKEAIAPYGTFFWFRPIAMKKLFDHDWQYEEFPPEPNNTDGTILHAVERLYPFAVQSVGYYPGIVMADKLASLEYTNLLYYVREYNKVITATGNSNYFHLMRDEIKRRDEENRYNKVYWQQEMERCRTQWMNEKKSMEEMMAALDLKRDEFEQKANLRYQLREFFRNIFHRN